MKHRNGFVSNSSTCSFWIYALPFSESKHRVKLDLFRNKLKKDSEAYAKFVDEMCETFSRMDDLRFLLENINSLNEVGEERLENFFNDDGLEYVAQWYDLDVMNYYDEWGTFVGRSWQSLGDDETPRQFRAKVDAAVKEMFGESAEAQSEEGEYSC